MEVDAGSTTPAEDRRKSGRATRRPDIFSQSSHSAKRKRGEPRGDDDSESDDTSESDSDEAADEDADEEELREKRRAARRATTKKLSKPKKSHAAKKPKVTANGLARQLAFRPANGRLPGSRPKKVRPRPSLAAGERGLFGM
jgi:cohesin complex subunit SA-1/2